jgi:hypothetical protein
MVVQGGQVMVRRMWMLQMKKEKNKNDKELEEELNEDAP